MLTLPPQAPLYALLLLLGGAVFLVFLLVGAGRPRLLITSFLLCYVVSLGNVDLFKVPVDARVVALPIVLVLCFARSSRIPWRSVMRNRAIGAAVCYLLLGAVLSPLSINQSQSLIGGANIALTLALVALFSTRISRTELIRSLFDASALTVMASVATVVAYHSRAVAGGRWRGVLGNANSLGIVCMFLILTRPKHTWAGRLATVVAGITLIGSGSRSSALGLSFGLIGASLGQLPRVLRRYTVLLASLASVYTFVQVQSATAKPTGSPKADNSLLRRTNTRGSYWSTAVHSIRTRLLGGYGIRLQPDEIPSSLLRPGAELGIWAVLPILFVFADIARVMRVRPNAIKAVYCGLVVNALFEGWFFGGNSLFFAVFLAASLLVNVPPRQSGSTSRQTSTVALPAVRSFGRRGLSVHGAPARRTESLRRSQQDQN